MIDTTIPNYRRPFAPGASWFFTVNLLDRSSGRARNRFPFHIDAFVVLPACREVFEVRMSEIAPLGAVIAGARVRRTHTPMARGRKRSPAGAEIRGLARALTVLRSLNLQNGATVTQLREHSGLSRPAIYRILRGLMESGFVSRGRIPRTYVLTSKVRSLSAGYTDDNLIAEIAAPTLDQLQRKVIWPTELATLQDVRMHLRDTTRHLSPMVIDGEVVGRSIPLLSTALGLAYLSACAPRRRQALLTRLRAAATSADPYPGDRPVRQLLEAVRAKGYAWREGGIVEGFRYQTSTIAVPIHVHDDVRAALAVTFFSSAMSVEQAAARYLADLRHAGQTIEKSLESVVLP